MPKVKIYSCCICHKILEDYKPIRLTKELYGLHYRGGHYPIKHYDFCNECYAKFNHWVKKHEKEQ